MPYDNLIIGHSMPANSFNGSLYIDDTETWLNRATGGWYTSQVLDALPDDLADSSPSKVYLHAGENDLSADKTMIWIMNNIQGIFDLVVDEGAVLQVTEMLPGKNVEPLQAMELNWRLRCWCISNNVSMAPTYYYYLDPDDERSLNDEMSGDGIHPPYESASQIHREYD